MNDDCIQEVFRCTVLAKLVAYVDRSIKLRSGIILLIFKM